MAKVKKAALTGKRQQIAHSNKMMFLWVAGASVVVAFALVASIFLIKQMVFQTKIIAAKAETNNTLQSNIDVAPELKKEVEKLIANPNLTDARAKADQNNLSVIFDALPYVADDIGFGSSLQSVLLSGLGTPENITINSLSSSTAEEGEEIAGVAVPEGAQELAFSFTITGSDKDIQEILKRFDRSIRPIQIDSLSLQAGEGGKVTASIQARTFYQPAKTLELTNKTVEP
ncbi:hypothetical protein KC939_00340 [Candidatus Saccharibacteria bacterium]|nr:hypothetical protein [Candidatus Saccharibacteria bacterium]